MELSAFQKWEWVDIKGIKTYLPERKQSLGQGNVFTPVCHSFHGGGVSLTDPPGQRPPALWTETPLDTDTPYGQERAVHILLECILVC